MELTGTMRLWFILASTLVAVLECIVIAKAQDQERRLLVVVGFFLLFLQCLLILFAACLWEI